uniref:Uncharacterized protein n=1 Tax=Tanacetum cinerariifolium TaxID=118510 RepID=A0A699I8G9_TANCI|nr:hypothetical protein [Tanacetum cinerariifolium]
MLFDVIKGLGTRVKSLGLGGDAAVPEGQQRAASIMETAVGKPLGLGYGALRHQEIALGEGRIPSVFEVAPPAQTPPSLEWSSGLLPVSQAHSIIPSPISLPMIPLIVPLLVASLVTAETEGFLTELGARVEMHGGLIRDHTVRLEELSPDLFESYDRDIEELFTRSGAVRDEIFS